MYNVCVILLQEELIEISLKLDDKSEKTTKIKPGPVRNEKLLEHAKTVFQRTDIDFIEFNCEGQSLELDWIKVQAGDILHPNPGDKFKFQVVSKKVKLYIANTLQTN